MQLNGSEQERVAMLPVGRGLFVLKYTSSVASVSPRIFVRASPSCENNLEIISPPGVDKGVLWAPGDCVVIVAERQGSLQLTVTAVSGGGLSANVDLEPLWLEPVAAAKKPAQRQKVAIEAVGRDLGKVPWAPERREGQAALSLMCHVARLGDVVVSGSEWVGGPESPAAIEGVRIDWVAPKGVALEYQVLASGADGRWSGWVFAGEFAGSRGRRLPLVGLRLRLVGEKSAGMQLKGEALFLGSAVASDVGDQLEFASYAGVDPLVGFRLELKDRVALEIERAVVGARSDKTNRLRVFKSNRSFEARNAS